MPKPMVPQSYTGNPMGIEIITISNSLNVN